MLVPDKVLFGTNEIHTLCRRSDVQADSPNYADMLAEVTVTVAFNKDTSSKQRLEATEMDGNKH